MKELLKIGVCGSNLYENKNEIKNTIFKLKQQFKDVLEIVSGGRPHGADTHIKKYALEFNCKYKEFNPAHTKKNLYSALHTNFYDKIYSPRNLYIRNALMIKYIDYMIVFVEEGKEDNDINYIIEETKKKGKRIIIIR